MSSTKTRGRPTSTQIIDTSTSPLISNIATTINSQSNAFQQQFVPSLLRIESVVPTRLNANRFQRVNRLITRSYSTLCGTSISSPSIAGTAGLSSPFSLSNGVTSTAAITTTTAPLVTPTSTSTATVNYKNVTKKINTNLQQRHKSNHYQRLDNGHESPSGKINNNQQTVTSETCCIIAENGIQKVRRTVKEKEKQPDRINLDRRGLCSIPIVDNEPSLRLLSLQHNLINTFHVPDNDVACNNTVDDGVKDNNNNNLIITNNNNTSAISTTLLKDDKVTLPPPTPTNNASEMVTNVAMINNKTTPMTMTTPPNKPFLKQKSISRNQLNFNFSANNINNNNNVNNNSSQGMVSSSSSSFLQKSSFMFPNPTKHHHGVLKRANSVMINYTPSTTSSSSPSLMFNGSGNGNGSAVVLAQRGKLVATPSFNVIDTHTHHEMATTITTTAAAKNSTSNSPDIQIDSNNSYLNSFRFNLTNLVFLDLYNNQIEKISNLDGLKSLTVLLLGKNRITDLSGIISLRYTLRVLDLHGNRITSIAKICQLQELKSLNLAGNQLRVIQPTDFAGLQHLKELNLKRNRIKKINVSDDLHNLERLWLCHNELQSIEDMSSIAKSINLKEITIENNPISLAGDCVSFLVSYLPLLNTLNQLQITEQVRRAANAWRRSKENSDKNFQNLSTDVSSSIRREEIISNARTNWELIRQANIINSSQRQNNHSRKFTKAPKLTPNNSSSSTSTTSSSNTAANSNNSNNNNNNNNNNNIGSMKNSSRQIIDVAKRHKSKLLKSSSAENSSLISSERGNGSIGGGGGVGSVGGGGDMTDVECEYFHLPPVLDEFVAGKGNKNQSAASSTRPNIDSESSAFSSDTDDQKSFKSQIPTTPPIQQQKVLSKPSTPVETIIIKEDDDDKDKTITMSPPLLPSLLNEVEQHRQPVAMIFDNNIMLNNNNKSFMATTTTTKTTTPTVATVAVVQLNNALETIKKDDEQQQQHQHHHHVMTTRKGAVTPTMLIVKEKSSPTLTIIDNNANGISLQPTINIDTVVNAIKSSSSTSALIENSSNNDAVDKLSIISKTSVAKASTDSINTLSSFQDEQQQQQHQQQRQNHTQHHHNNNNTSTSNNNQSTRIRSNSRKLGPPLVRSQTARNLSSHLNSNNQQNNVNGGGLNNQNSSNGNNNQRKELKKEMDKDRETGGDYLVEILGRYLNVYGMGAIKFIDKQWNTQKAQDVHTVKFSYINFNNISPVLGKIKVRFPNVENYVFRETNLVCLGQLNAMADTQGLKSITIDPEGNPLANKNWRAYAIYRLGHWGLKQINGVEISEEEINEAEITYGGLSELVLWSLPDSLLQPLFTRLRVDETLSTHKMTPKEWLMKQADENIRQVVGKEALQWKKNSASQDEMTIRRKGKVHFSAMMENTVNAVEKLQKLEYLWPNVLLELIRNTLIDYSQIDLYVRNLMSEVVKEN